MRLLYTSGGSLIKISPDAPEGAASHELFHNSGVEANDYQSGGILNSPPQPLLPQEVDELWDKIPEQK